MPVHLTGNTSWLSSLINLTFRVKYVSNQFCSFYLVAWSFLGAVTYLLESICFLDDGEQGGEYCMRARWYGDSFQSVLANIIESIIPNPKLMNGSTIGSRHTSLNDRSKLQQYSEYPIKTHTLISPILHFNRRKDG